MVAGGGQHGRVDEADAGDDAAGRQLTALRVEQQQHPAAIQHRGGGHLHEDLLTGPPGFIAAVAPARVTARSTSPAAGASRCTRAASSANATCPLRPTSSTQSARICGSVTPARRQTSSAVAQVGQVPDARAVGPGNPVGERAGVLPRLVVEQRPLRLDPPTVGEAGVQRLERGWLRHPLPATHAQVVAGDTVVVAEQALQRAGPGGGRADAHTQPPHADRLRGQSGAVRPLHRHRAVSPGGDGATARQLHPVGRGHRRGAVHAHRRAVGCDVHADPVAGHPNRQRPS